MKVQILNSEGGKVKELTTNLFDNVIREDIVQKVVEIDKTKQPYSPFYLAGNQTSASGNARHKRHAWKSDRGKGMARMPKKRMWDRGTQFSWVGAVVPGTRGGRRAHPPKIIRSTKKINKKERKLAFKSSLAMVSSEDLLKKKYTSLKEIKLKLPIIVESKILTLKPKEFMGALRKILVGDLFKVAIKKKEIRAGIGKLRGRKYKENAGLLLIIGNEENKNVNSIDIKKVKDLNVSDLASNGARLCVFTEEAIKNMEKKI